MAVAIKFATEFWVDYRDIKTTTNVKKEIRKIILKQIVAIYIRNSRQENNISRLYSKRENYTIYL